MTDAKSLYLDLMKKVLTYYIWGETYQSVDLSDVLPFRNYFIRNYLPKFLDKHNLSLVSNYCYDPEKRANGLDWPPLADTMIGLKRLDNLQMCLEGVIKEGVPGDVIETGVWRGGGSIFMKAVLAAYGITDRTVWVADSFAGLPEPDILKYPEDTGDVHHTISLLAVSCSQVKANFEKYGLLDNQVRFLEGWFRDTLPAASNGASCCESSMEICTNQPWTVGKPYPNFLLAGTSSSMTMFCHLVGRLSMIIGRHTA